MGEAKNSFICLIKISVEKKIVSSGKMAAVIARPACMRGQAAAWTKKLLVACTISLPRKRAYREYYKTFDPEKDAQDMIRLGVFKSWNCKGERTGHPYD